MREGSRVWSEQNISRKKCEKFRSHFAKKSVKTFFAKTIGVEAVFCLFRWIVVKKLQLNFAFFAKQIKANSSERNAKWFFLFAANPRGKGNHAIGWVLHVPLNFEMICRIMWKAHIFEDQYTEVIKLYLFCTVYCLYVGVFKSNPLNYKDIKIILGAERWNKR